MQNQMQRQEIHFLQKQPVSYTHLDVYKRQEQIRDPKIECMSRDEMHALQSERLVKQVKNVYDNVAFYRRKMDELGVLPLSLIHI